jgi:hypothetical protein
MARGMGKAAHAVYLQRFAREPVMRQVMEVYQRVLAGAAPSTQGGAGYAERER